MVARALIPPETVAALVVLIAGVAKLRAPAAAAEAVATLGARRLGAAGRARAVRFGAAAEVVLAGAALAGAWATTYLLAAVYLVFAAVALVLLRVNGDCGCFGETGAPVSVVHVNLNLVLAALCAAAGMEGSGGVGEVLRLPVAEAVAASLGILAAAGAAVLAYTELPRAWAAWSGAAG